ncbi:hypothetical protein NOCARDAX2BIS_220068 [Nocardioides sp. AX2bis]|nr:hypothetical protein NOCARDAX2BIS_220068 [Nocardioides sp. AX2bis]
MTFSPRWSAGWAAVTGSWDSTLQGPPFFLLARLTPRAPSGHGTGGRRGRRPPAVAPYRCAALL